MKLNKDWFFWVDWSIIIMLIILYIQSFPLQQWEWGFINIKFLATFIVTIGWIAVRTMIISNRRWEYIKKQFALQNKQEK